MGSWGSPTFFGAVSTFFEGKGGTGDAEKGGGRIGALLTSARG